MYSTQAKWLKNKNFTGQRTKSGLDLGEKGKVYILNVNGNAGKKPSFPKRMQLCLQRQ